LGNPDAPGRRSGEGSKIRAGSSLRSGRSGRLAPPFDDRGRLRSSPQDLRALMLILPFLLAHLSLALLGAGVAFHPSLRGFSAGARLAAAFAAGAVLRSGGAIVFSAFVGRWVT